MIPRSESYRMLGVLFNSSAFENRVNSEEFVSMTYMFGGTEDPTALELSDVEIEKIITGIYNFNGQKNREGFS